MTLRTEIYLRKISFALIIAITFVVTSFGGASAETGGISGRITDDLGNPIPNEGVRAFTDTCTYDVIGGTFTDGEGNYEFTSVPVGSVYIRTCIATCGSDKNFIDEWYGTENHDCAQAEAVPITAGQTAENINLSLASGGMISGRLTTDTGDPISGGAIQAFSNGCGDAQHIGNAYTDATGTYTFTGLPAGSAYLKTCSFCGAKEYIDEWYGTDSTDCGQADAISVTLGQTVTGIDFAVASTNPAIKIVEPNTANEPVDDVFRITWIDGDVDSNALITIYYDIDQNTGDGVEIASTIFEDGPNYLDWDVSGFTGGETFYIYGTITDGSESDDSFSAGTVMISPDGMPKAWEEANGLDGYRNDSGDDIDGDGLTNLEEYNNSTNPRNSDSDGDGMPDGWEVTNSLAPNIDDADLDPDGDLFTNIEEWRSQSDPGNPASSPPYSPMDLNKDRNVDLMDATFIMQVLSGMSPANVDSGADINGDGKIGIEELLHVLQVIAGIKPPLLIPYAYLQYRTLPCGTDRYQGWVELTKYGLPIENGDIFRIEMRDGNGNDTGAHLSQYYESLSYSGIWNEGAQSVDYSGPYRYTGYSVRFPEDSSLLEGDYTYTVVPVVGQEISKTFHFPGQETIPVVSAGTISYEWIIGDLRISWTNPGGNYDQLRIVLMDENWIDRLYLRLPTDIEEIVIPNEVIENITTISDIDPVEQIMRLQIQTRKYFEDPISHPYDYARGFDCVLDVPWP